MSGRHFMLCMLLMALVVLSMIGLVTFSHATRQARMRERHATDRPESAWMDLTEEQRDAIRRSWK